MWWRDFQRFTTCAALMLACVISPYLLLAVPVAWVGYHLLPRRERP